MPNEQKHREQFTRNKQLLDTDVFGNSHNDWKITVVFYCAVHVIETFLSRINVHTSNHKARHKSVNQLERLKRISGEYQTLYMMSLKSRYECVRFTESDVNAAVELLKKIEDIVLGGC